MLLPMKKLATAFAALATLSLAAPAFACPNMDKEEVQTPRTADKDKAAKPATDTAKASDAKPADKAKAAPDKAKDTKPANAKPGDKVTIN